MLEPNKPKPWEQAGGLFGGLIEDEEGDEEEEEEEASSAAVAVDYAAGLIPCLAEEWVGALLSLDSIDPLIAT